jgi:hypothetical protein
MTDGESAGIYNDEDDQWHLYFNEGGSTNLYHAGSAKAFTTSTGFSINGNINLTGTGSVTLTGTVDGRDVAADGAKLDGIQAGATAGSSVTNNNQLTNGAGYTTNVGDITGVTAGTNLTGGGTSGAVTLGTTTTPTFTWVSATDLYVHDQIMHAGDTNTYMQFHNQDQWRVVTGGSERLEVTNSAITSTLPIFATYLSTNDYLYHTGDTDTKIGFPGDNTIMGYVGGDQGFSQTTSAFNSYKELRGWANVIAYYSDERLKTKIGDIENAVEKVKTLDAFYYVENDLAKSFGYNSDKKQVALSAQDVQKVLPEAVTLAPFDMEDDHETGETYSKSGENYLTVDYAKMVPLLIQAIKEQQQQIDTLKAEVDQLRGK